jgi:hypothetical protein
MPPRTTSHDLDTVEVTEPTVTPTGGPGGMDLRTKICLWIILIGMANFLAYTISYAILWGEAVNGRVEFQAGRVVYLLQSGKEVSRAQFVYSGIHSIAIWPTVMAVLLALLTLAKDRITDSMQSAAMRGRTLCTILAVLIAISMSGLTFLFISQFSAHLDRASRLAHQSTTAPAETPAAESAPTETPPTP